MAHKLTDTSGLSLAELYTDEYSRGARPADGIRERKITLGEWYGSGREADRIMIARWPAILLSLMPVECSNGVPDPSLPEEYVKPLPPSEKALVASVPAVGIAAKLSGPLEVSDVRPTNHGPGRYFVCLREASPPPSGRPRYYSVFFDNEAYKGERLSVIMDQCETQSYRLLPAPGPAVPLPNAKSTPNR
jgi:hypothetical protein